ncbi:Origin recognition complex subunit 1 [Wickerhamomyces ciferrii]|uniref:Cell division control protein n=1 Tax=Wickerhamomyces ciferrii (strain ATCC 14091 / BCRC 22168 / CBS 111 / JCM 3599 / NBRC 0793 / NRRL Y-1031 F-60-10) TaxID=1206466 RepID=K0KFL2_WICCF|nr:Origin recognition complex subunit 1 [Wickerhamomyces ciferrii]CCH41716.1 Origin recognition complex subunit 1 [Wickerhamomyces ciferrii]
MSQSTPSTTITPTTPTTPGRVSKVLSMLKSSLTPNSIQPRSRKRSSSTINGNKISIPMSPGQSPVKVQSHIQNFENLEQSPIKRQKIQHSLESPPNTPTKSKPSTTTTQIQSTTIQSPVKKLDFKQFITKPNDSLISPPVTPIKSDKDVLISENLLTTKKLNLIEHNPEEDKENIEPKTHEPQQTQPQKSIYAEAKSLFQRSSLITNTFTLPQREQESQAFQQFIENNLSSQTSNSLYISGPPGTGKTAQTLLTLSKWINTNQHGVQLSSVDSQQLKIGYTMINCMILPQIKYIFQDIYKNLTGKNCSSIINSKTELLNYLTSGDDQMNIIVLDELDKLITQDQQILFELFSWTIQPNSKIILIGISNSLDMIDRLLPRLKINGLNPNTLSFLPYTSEQIKQIIISKLKTLIPSSSNSNEIPIIHPAAIQLAAKKSSNNTGDLRKAFDICRSSIEIVEKEVRGNILQENSNHLMLNWETAPKVKINHIARVCALVFDNHQTQRLKRLNLQQKFIICVLIKKESENQGIITMNSLFEYYIQNIKIDKLIGVLKKGEFLEVLTALESIGVIKMIRSNKEYSQMKLNSSLSKKDLKLIVQGINILETFMEGLV